MNAQWPAPLLAEPYQQFAVSYTVWNFSAEALIWWGLAGAAVHRATAHKQEGLLSKKKAFVIKGLL